MRIALDTNVLVSGLLSPHGRPAEIVRLVAGGAVSVCYDARAIAEYRDVLLRPRFGFEPADVDALLAQLKAEGLPVSAAPLHVRLPDPDDEVFLEIALAARADALVTGNKRHFPASHRQGIRVLDPAEFLEEWRASPGTEQSRRS